MARERGAGRCGPVSPRREPHRTSGSAAVKEFPSTGWSTRVTVASGFHEETKVRYHSKRVAVAFGVLVALASGAGCQQQSAPTLQTKKTAPQTEQKTIPTPYRIAEIKEQPKINQCLIQVVVPDGSTRQQIQQWHHE